MSERNHMLPEAPFTNLDSHEAATPSPTEFSAPYEAGGMEDMVKQYLAEIGREPLMSAEEEVVVASQIEAGLAADRIRLLRQEPDDETLYGWCRHKPELRPHYEAVDAMLLKRSEYITTAELEQLSLLGAQAKDRFIRANLRLVVTVAKRYPTPTALSLLDHIQEGNAGLVRAVEKFDATQGFKFSTYGMWWIRQAISRAIAETSRTVRLPVNVHDEAMRMIRSRRELVTKLERDPSVEEIAKAMDTSPERVKELITYHTSPTSLSMPLDDEERPTELGDIIVDRDFVSADVQYERAEFTQTVQRALAARMGKDADECFEVMNRYYGLDGAKPMSLKAVGKELGYNAKQVQRLIMRAMVTLQDELAGYQDLFD